MESAKAMLVSMMAAVTAPEINPHVRTIFFMAALASLPGLLPAARKLAHVARVVVTRSGDFQGMRREAWPIWTAWVRRLAPSLSKSRLEWVFTVFSLTQRRL